MCYLFEQLAWEFLISEMSHNLCCVLPCFFYSYMYKYMISYLTTQFIVQSRRGPVFTYELSIVSSTALYVSYYSPDHSKPDLIIIVALNGSSCELEPTKMV